jgi:F-type H+-transporting ATPase subunit b
MIIDWFTVIAQAINFLVLVWVMKRFLYKPILDAIDAREKRIALALAEAEAKPESGTPPGASEEAK